MYNILDENDYLVKALDYENPDIQAIQNVTSILSEYDFQSLFDEWSNTKTLSDLIQPVQNATSILSEYDFQSLFDEWSNTKTLSDLIQPVQNATSILSEYDFQSLFDEWSNAKTLSDLIQPDIQAIQNATSFFSECDFQSLLDKFFIDKDTSDLLSSEFFSDSLKLNIDKSKDRTDNITKLLSKASPVLSFEDVDLSELEMILNTSIKYSNKVLSNYKVSKEIKLHGEEAKQNPKSLHDKLEDFKKKFCLLLIIIRLIMSIPQTIETGEFYKDVATKVKTSILNEAQYCWVIKERAYLREAANAKSKVLYRFIYDTKLEIISEIPRWLEVKYVDESGNEYIGWISKISVEKE